MNAAVVVGFDTVVRWLRDGDYKDKEEGEKGK